MILCLGKTVQQLIDLLCCRANLFYGQVMVQNVHNACQIFAHISFQIVRTVQKIRIPVIQVGGDDTVNILFFKVVIKFFQTVSEKSEVVQTMTRLAFLSFNCFATSSMLSPEEIMSSMTITSFPSTESPKNSWATMGFLPLITVE